MYRSVQAFVSPPLMSRSVLEMLAKLNLESRDAVTQL
jgi:hypothetical protein